jgi:hypothetical protein
MFRRLEYAFLIGSLALIGADRVDLLLGKASFRLTPFLVCASACVFLRLSMIAMQGRLDHTISPPMHRQIPYLAGLAVFIFLASVATIFGMDPQRGLMALADLILISILAYCISLRLLADPAPEKLILRSISFGLFVYLVFCIGESIAWKYGIIQTEEGGGSWLENTFAAKTLFWVPRLSGFTIDENRSGFILVMYMALLDRYVPKSRYKSFLRYAIAVFILLAVSRSAMLCWFAYWLFSKASWSRTNRPRIASWGAGIAIASLLIGFAYHKEIGDALYVWDVSDIISDRLSGQEGTSGGDHIRLIKRGFDTWLSTPHTMATGIGLASAPKVLGDFFGDDKYGNFHCLYVTILAELGLPAFLVLMVLLAYPMIGRKSATASIAAIMVFNAPYQSHMEPIFWLMLALVWSYESKTHSQLHSLTVPKSGCVLSC